MQKAPSEVLRSIRQNLEEISLSIKHTVIKGFIGPSEPLRGSLRPVMADGEQSWSTSVGSYKSTAYYVIIDVPKS